MNFLICIDQSLALTLPVEIKHDFPCHHLALPSSLEPEDYYSCTLDWMNQHKAGDQYNIAILLGRAWPLSENELPNCLFFLPDDINGLMYQPLCRTFDSEGGVRFTGVSQLFNPGLKDGLKHVLKCRKMDYSTGIAAAIPHPWLLSAAEKEVLRKMGAEIAVDRLYLNARAARACGIPAAGLTAVAESGGQLQQIVLYLLEYLIKNKSHN